MDDPRVTQPAPGGKARRKAIILPAMAAIAVAGTAGAILLPGAFAAAENPADTMADKGKSTEKAEQPEYPLPDLPPLGEDERYMWEVGERDEQSDEADQYGAAFFEWFEKNDFELTDTWGPKLAYYEIWKEKYSDDGSATGDPTGESIPTYVAAAAAEKDGELGDSLDMRVHPKASFEPGPGETYEHLANCTDYEEPVDGTTAAVTFDCEETDGPDGSEILTVTETHADSKTDDVFWVKNTAVLYRADGTAVVVSDETPGNGYTGPYPVPSDTAPHFSGDQLAELALSMPDVIVGD